MRISNKFSAPRSASFYSACVPIMPLTKSLEQQASLHVDALMPSAADSVTSIGLNGFAPPPPPGWLRSLVTQYAPITLGVMPLPSTEFLDGERNFQH